MKKNSQTALNVLAIVVGMFGLAYASAPLYDAFCKLTGYAGTPNTENIIFPDKIYNRKIKVLFNTDVEPKLNWSFKPLQDKVNVKIGENKLVFFEAQNLDVEAVTGVATYNVVPEKAAKYFTKLQCFCFNKQLLKSQQKMTFPVSFYIDPEIMNDKNLDDIKSLTLSYTFFEAKK
jgi:cytochrome c oxidase assembly protein subunit 11